MAWRALFVTLALIAGGIADPRPGAAQNTPANGILARGNAVVTGFSGVRSPASAPRTGDPDDKTFIDTNGPSVRVIDLQNPGAPPTGQLVRARKLFTATAAQVGQVFGVALDDAAMPSIYVAATSAYGLPIVVGADRARLGAPGAAFMPGLFGPAAQRGGPGSIWRIDGATGAVRLFANVTLDNVPNSGPALGGLAFDTASRSLFVADRETGMIHRFDMRGTEQGRFDHGVTGRTAAGRSPIPFNPARRLDITQPQFSTDDASTWGYAPPERRIFGLGVREGRLYYAVADGLEIWSVAIDKGAFEDPRLETTVPQGGGRTEISKITFDDQGRMLLAERPAPTGNYGYYALTQEGAGRVLRYAAAAPGSWQLPDEYAIGFPTASRNGNGGVAVGYGYDAGGRINRTSCGGFVWATGERLRVTDDTPASGEAIVNGLQGNGIDLVRPANVPPQQSYFVDYDDRFDDPDARGHMGDIAIDRECDNAGADTPVPPAPPPTPPPPPPPPPPPSCPADQIAAPGGACCLRTQLTATGVCCPQGQRPTRDRKACEPDRPPGCEQGFTKLPSGQCCPAGQATTNGQCCPQGQRASGGQCLCPSGAPANPRTGQCAPPPEQRCPAGTFRRGPGQPCICENGRPPNAQGRCWTPNQGPANRRWIDDDPPRNRGPFGPGIIFGPGRGPFGGRGGW